MGLSTMRDEDLEAELLLAAGDFDRWPRLLEAVADRYGAMGAAIVPAHDTSLMRYTSSMQAGFEAYIADGVYLDDKRLALYPKLSRSKVVNDHDAYSPQQMARMEYYQEWLPAQDCGPFAALRGSAGEEPLVMAVYRSRADGEFEAEQMKAMEPVADALSRAIALDRAVGSLALAQRIDWHERTGAAVIALDRRGIVKSVSEEATRLLGKGIAVRHRRLVLGDADGERALEKALRQSSEIAHAANLGLAHARTMPDRVHLRTRMPGLDARSPFVSTSMLVIDVHPIVEGYRGFVSAAHLLVVSDPFAPRAADRAAFQALWDLSPREAELTAHLAEGCLLAEAAHLMGIREASARTYLKSIYRKTGTRAQSELVARAARL